MASNLPEIEVVRIRQQYEEQLEALAADISAYKEGRATGLLRGEDIGYEKGYRVGYNDGVATAAIEGNDQAFRAGVETVLGELRSKQYEFQDELRFQTYLIAPRRKSLIAMNDLIERIITTFRAPEQEPPGPDQE